MHIEEIIIDGFKSYSTRVPVGPFDRQFNAITGRSILNPCGQFDLASEWFRERVLASNPLPPRQV